MKTHYTSLSITDLVQNLRANPENIQDYITEVLQLMTDRDDKIKAFLPEAGREDRLRREARELARHFDKPDQCPPLFGVLVGVKDLFNVDGLPTRAGSKLPPEVFEGSESTLVKQLKEAGAIVLGKTVSTEFAYFCPGETRNPINTNHTPGGSSSGSAAAVAAGFCPLAIGTQTIASITRPASYCSILGFKPTQGYLSTEGVFPFSQSADHAGFFCRNISDTVYVTEILLPGALNSGTFDSEVIGRLPHLAWFSGSFFFQADSASRQIFLAQIDQLRDRGYEILSIDDDFPLCPVADIDTLNLKHKRLIAAEFYHNHKLLYEQFSGLYSEASSELYTLGKGIDTQELEDLKSYQQTQRSLFKNFFGRHGFDLIISPSTTSTAPLGLESTGSPLMSLPFTHAGLPTITIPSGADMKGLPFGIQIIAPQAKDLFLLYASRAMVP
ncbi:MAG: amidase [Candidatus Cloacimonadaceae bacterium]|nr:amidase [Candidatus Cloacimonadaceae bacterium]